MQSAIIPLSGDEIAIRTGDIGHFTDGDALHGILHRQVVRESARRVRQEAATQEMEPVPQLPSVSRGLFSLWRWLFGRRDSITARDRRVMATANRNLRAMGR